MSLVIAYRCQNGAMVPIARYRDEFARDFKEGELYRLEEVQERSQVSHSHYFAALTEAWKNLPEEYSERFPKVEHLRAWALIKTGHHNSRSIVADNAAEARKIGSFIKPMDEFAVVTVIDAVVTVYTAKSQSRKEMDKAEFQKSKSDVLELVATMARTDKATLQENAGASA